jgi:5-hydroxyisourate hydrolase-like protein (transthyretin family)
VGPLAFTEHLFDTGGMPSGRRKPDPDRILCARLSGTAIRLARAGGSIDEAVAELRTLAGGRGDLLAEEAGLMAGTWSVWIGTGDYLLAAGLLVSAGADHDEIARWVAVGRERATTPLHSI